MPSSQNRTRLVVAVLIILGGILPVGFYRQFVGRVPSVTPEKAKELLADRGAAAVLVDVRTPAEFRENHLEAAENWPYQELAGLDSPTALPKQFQGKRLLLICQSGIMRRWPRSGFKNSACRRSSTCKAGCKPGSPPAGGHVPAASVK